MPYKSIDELPKSVRHVLPKHAQEIYKEAFNSAWDNYKESEREDIAHRVAWHAVKQSYKKGSDELWHKK
ncbi:MAG: ChaB family protein [Chlamydiia bacterium]|nr:ChaB family protein [Chlamydiia bacterium]